MNKYLLIFILLLTEFISAQVPFNPACNCYEPEVKQQTPASVTSGSRSTTTTGITCSPNTFWVIGDTSQVIEFELNSSVIINHGIVASGYGNSLAFCNNLNGGAFSPTFYSTTGNYTSSYYNGTNWTMAAGTSPTAIPNIGGNGSFLYLLNNSPGTNTIVKYNGGSYSTIYNDPNLNFACADLAVDDSGNIWCLRGSFPLAWYLDVISPIGLLLKRYNISLNSEHAYGCFLLNNIFYVGLGYGNTIHPNTLIPFSFGIDTAIQGNPINFTANYPYDMASCNTGAPLTACSFGSPTINTPNTNICGNTSTQICATPGLAKYSWNTGDSTACITAAASGNYFVTVTDNSNCTAASNTVVITINTAPVVAVSTVDNIFCAGDSTEVCATPGFVNYLWNNAKTDSCFQAHQAGNYNVTVTDNNGCTASSNPIAVNVYPLPSVSISVNGDTLTSYNGVTYQWYLNGNVINGAIDNMYEAKQGGSYTVAITDTNGCSVTSNPVIVLGIHNLSPAFSVNVYPNPLDNGFWNVECENDMLGSQIEIYDADGRLFFESTITKTQSQIELNAERGIYMLRISSANNAIVKKLIRL